MKLLVKDGLVIDGTGAPLQKADILIENGIIVSINPDHANANVEDAHIIQARDRVVCPGFIDIHRHADAAVFSPFPAFGKTELLQGITTVVAGNCGLSVVPGNHPWQKDHFRYIEPGIGPASQLPVDNHHQYRAGLEKLSLPVNFGFLVGGGAVKTSLKGFSRQAFTRDELNRACSYIRDALDAGALGLSFGLMYQSECYSTHNELVAMANAAAGTILCVHIRGEGDSLVDSVDEVITLARESGLPLNISHFKSTGIKNWQNLIYRAIEKIEKARSNYRGILSL
jgi:N-acyl-D-aspartate/D-glutamate deacylase